MNADTLRAILAEHAKWLADPAMGARATLRDATLTDADLTGADLSYANLHGATLHGATLYGADLTHATIWPGWKLVRA